MTFALLALLACAPSPERTAASLHPAATALMIGMGLASRLVVVDDASRRLRGAEQVPSGPPAGPPARLSLVLLSPRDPRPSWIPPDTPALRVEPQSLDALFALVRAIGAALDADDRADAWIAATRLGLTRLSASSFGRPRPHLAAVVSLEPLEIAGGDSVETELIEIAGAESVTHGGRSLRVALGDLSEEHRTPDLWLLIAPAPLGDDELARARARLPAGAAAEVFVLSETWLADPVAVAARLRARVEQIATSPREPSPPGASPRPPPQSD